MCKVIRNSVASNSERVRATQMSIRVHGRLRRARLGRPNGERGRPRCAAAGPPHAQRQGADSRVRTAAAAAGRTDRTRVCGKRKRCRGGNPASRGSRWLARLWGGSGGRRALGCESGFYSPTWPLVFCWRLYQGCTYTHRYVCVFLIFKMKHRNSSGDYESCFFADTGGTSHREGRCVVCDAPFPGGICLHLDELSAFP